MFKLALLNKLFKFKNNEPKLINQGETSSNGESHLDGSICPECGKHKMKCHLSCYDCWYKKNKTKKKNGTENELHYCQNQNCQNRLIMCREKYMIKYKEYFFCSDFCIEEFKILLLQNRRIEEQEVIDWQEWKLIFQ